ncbi:MAG TPA: YHS domain-containing (seleno)protein [Opitutaceae bacterium]|nr:YHS domain-containing (seleno)protein [Opitutaceae bacterium]
MTLHKLRFALLAAALTATSLTAAPVNTNWRGLAIKGYDPVAYFTDAKPVEGDAKFTFEWEGAKWRFASAEHRDAFAKEPARYAPQFGGYCAWAVSQGYTADVDPKAWKIVEGKLYLNYNKDVQETWEKDASDNITNGEANWPKLKDK